MSRWWRGAVAVSATAIVALLGACAPGPASPRTVGSAPSASPSPDAPPTGRPVDEPRACAEVRAGITDFNAGDYAGTVAHFEEAVPLAREAADSDDSRAAADLLEAVEYYADLAPADYPDAARSSPDFARYKAITLGQCTSPSPAPAPDAPSTEPGVPV